jgi:hypothetical protein
MKFTIKIILFIVAFSFIFHFLHESDFYNTRIILADLGGIPWLYASIGTLFSILAGFIIQKEWENWNSLVDAVNGEVNTLREIWLWSRYLPTDASEIFHNSIKSYLEEMSESGLEKSEQEITSNRIEESISSLNAVMFNMFQDKPFLAANTFTFFTKLIEKRTERVRHSSHHVPKAIKRIIFLATTLIICLSMFIGVKNIWLDYTFTMSLSILAYSIYLVIDDLDHPLVPGGWHLTASAYKKLLERISSVKEN